MSFRPAHIECPTCGAPFFQSEQWKRTCLTCWKRRKNASTSHPEPARQVPAIPGDMLKLLLHLSHPDKHGDSLASTRATQWLLEQRRGQRA